MFRDRAVVLTAKLGVLGIGLALLLVGMPVQAASSLTVTKLELNGTQLRAEGTGAQPGNPINVDGTLVGVAGPDGRWKAETNAFASPICNVTISDGVTTVVAALPGCEPAGGDAAPLPVGASIKTFGLLRPPLPLPDGVAPNGGGRAEIELVVGTTEKLKLDIEDVEVIGDAADPAFCLGFYEVVLVKDGVEAPLPAFPGLLVVCEVAGDHQGPTAGMLNFSQRLNAGDQAIDPRGATLQIWQVEVVRDPITLAPIEGLNGEPFVIEERVALALEGVLN